MKNRYFVSLSLLNSGFCLVKEKLASAPKEYLPC